jgi:hypothetical protein
VRVKYMSLANGFIARHRHKSLIVHAFHLASADAEVLWHRRARPPQTNEGQSLAISNNMVAQWRKATGRWPWPTP